ncbi:MAG: hypothetical protein R3F40_09190 [Candidatus Competibacteraceae bacterium]
MDAAAARLFDGSWDRMRTMTLAVLDAVPDLVFIAMLILVIRYILKM